MATTAQLTATPFDASSNVLVNRVITFTSDTPSVATVTNTGLVSAVAVGTATITTVCEGKTATVPVTVVNANTVASIALTPTSSTVTVGSTVQLSATPEDSGGNPVSATVVWSSGTPADATVDQSGLVTGVAAGSSTITAAVGAVTATSAITVASGSITRNVWFAADTLTLTDGQTVQTWTDANGIAASQSVSGERPVYHASAIGGKPGVDFAVGKALKYTNPDSAAFTRFVVAEVGADGVPASDAYIFLSPMAWMWVRTNGAIRFQINKTGGTIVEWDSPASTINLATPAAHVFEVAYDASNLANNPTVKVDGGTALTMTLSGGTQSGTRVSDAGQAFIGSDAGLAHEAQGPVCEVVNIPDTSDHTTERQRLGTKYGITIT